MKQQYFKYTTSKVPICGPFENVLVSGLMWTAYDLLFVSQYLINIKFNFSYNQKKDLFEISKNTIMKELLDFSDFVTNKNTTNEDFAVFLSVAMVDFISLKYDDFTFNRNNYDFAMIRLKGGPSQLASAPPTFFSDNHILTNADQEDFFDNTSSLLFNVLPKIVLFCADSLNDINFVSSFAKILKDAVVYTVKCCRNNANGAKFLNELIQNLEKIAKSEEEARKEKEAAELANLLKAYKILGLEEYSTEREVKKAQRKLLHKLHPDKANNAKEQEEFTAKSQEINNAFNIIMDYYKAHPEYLEKAEEEKRKRAEREEAERREREAREEAERREREAREEAERRERELREKREKVLVVKDEFRKENTILKNLESEKDDIQNRIKSTKDGIIYAKNKISEAKEQIKAKKEALEKVKTEIEEKLRDFDYEVATQNGEEVDFVF